MQFVRGATPQTIAEKVGKSPADIVKVLFMAGEMVTATTSLSDDAIELIAADLGYHAEIIGVEEELDAEPEEEVDEAALVPRPPVVTVMGHVDHGKTKLLDAIRETDVVAGEFGGITQHIGAYQAHLGERTIAFIDTPGHEAFTAMRARGAKITDIVVLVVAADDGVMPQTVEALDHAKAAAVPIIVAVNKVDKEDADPVRVRTQMVELGIVPSEYGGTYEFVDVSAKTKQGLDSLLETILLVADLEELKGDPTGHARGAVIEAHLDKGRGPVATVLVQKGTLSAGDALVCGTAFAKIRAMQDENGLSLIHAGLSKPVADPRVEPRAERGRRLPRGRRRARGAPHRVGARGEDARGRAGHLASADALRPDASGRARRGPRAQPHREGRRPGFAGRALRRAAEAAAGRGAREHRARRGRRHHRGRHLAGARVELHRDRVQRAPGQAGARARREGRRRRPPLPRDLRRDRRHQGRALRAC